MEAYEEDIIEEVLNNGVTSACEKFEIERNNVIQTVQPFLNEIDNGINQLCPCEKDRIIGRATMCFFCEGPIKKYRTLK